MISKTTVWLLTLLAAFTVANLYYNQPLLPDIARTYGVSNGSAGIVAVLTQIGYAIGLVASLAMTRFLASFLVGVTSYDPTTFVTVAFLLTGAAFVACYIPARRAMCTDPMEALRYE